MKCKALCIVYYYSVGPYIAFIFSNWILSCYRKNNYNTIYVQKTCLLLLSVLFAVLKIFNTFNFP